MSGGGGSGGGGSEQWQNVDGGADPAAMVTYLDQASAALRERRAENIRRLEVGPGDRVLDVGCGAHAARVHNPDIGRTLRRLALDAGLEVREFTGTFTTAGLPTLAAVRTALRLDELLAELVGAGALTDQAPAAWLEGLAAAERAGRFYCGVVGFRLVGRNG
jgi:hypothetical protein